MRDDVNSGLDVSVFSAVLDSGDAAARLALAVQLARLVADEATASGEREQVTPILLKLSVDAARNVRVRLARELCEVSWLHPDLAFSIVADEDEIGLPFLSQTPALNDWHLMAILKVGDEARQQVIASRSDLSSEIANHVLQHGSLTAVRALLKNPIVVIDDADCRLLFSRFGQVEDIVELLLAKADLPLDIRITQARRVATRLRQEMAEKSWLASGDVREIVSDAEDSAVMQVLIEANDDERAKAMAFLALKNMLTPALLVRAASKGQMRVVEAGLSHLTGQNSARVCEQMYSTSKIGFKAMFRRSGLPRSCQGVVRAACDVYAEARNEGVGLREDEFGKRVLEALMTRYEQLDQNDRAKQIEFVGRYGEERVRKIAKLLKADMLRAA